ncbi:MAG: hypothetical protein BGN84_02755 [Afipia sp. 62-7]|uniref:hypothetical protein n=1 Tax=Xanthobacter autotrophicus TaxID=280 RepID=UPI00092C54F6|nr:MAG: hypothetical protein BGN84_02755 [Afipia sp. 62-7]
MSKIHSLYVKWRAFRDIIGHPKSDAELAREIFGADDGPVRFTKVLHGDVGCAPWIADEITNLINKRLAGFRAARSLPALPSQTFKGSDLALPVYWFTSRLIAAAGTIDEDRLERGHVGLLEELAIVPSPNQAEPKLVVEHYQGTRSFAPFLPSGRRIEFKPGDKGQIAFTGVSRAPVAGYAMLTRDPAGYGQRLWEADWAETVLWLPSPFLPTWSDGRALLMPEPQPASPLPGRFIVTSVLVWDEKVIAKLDPRGARPPAAALDEEETTRFLTNLRRVLDDKQRKWAGAVTAGSAEYSVTA